MKNFLYLYRAKIKRANMKSFVTKVVNFLKTSLHLEVFLMYISCLTNADYLN